MALTDKQKRFADEYLIDSNATQAAIRAGYSKKTARAIGNENLTKPDIQNYMKERLEEIESAKIADVQEVMEYLTSVMRREKNENIVVTVTEEKTKYVKDSDGVPRKHTEKKEIPQIVEIPTKVSDANKAAELIGKRYSLFTDKVEMDADVDLDITIDYGDGCDED